VFSNAIASLSVISKDGDSIVQLPDFLQGHQNKPDNFYGPHSPLIDGSYTMPGVRRLAQCNILNCLGKGTGETK
jgi:hypothetical protein